MIVSVLSVLAIPLIGTPIGPLRWHRRCVVIMLRGQHWDDGCPKFVRVLGQPAPLNHHHV